MSDFPFDKLASGQAARVPKTFLVALTSLRPVNIDPTGGATAGASGHAEGSTHE